MRTELRNRGRRRPTELGDWGMPKRVDLSPLENGLDYLRSVVDALAGDPTTRDLKYAVLHLAAGIEVLAKYRLHCEHWTLVVSKLDDPKIDRAAFERGDFTSVQARSP